MADRLGTQRRTRPGVHKLRRDNLPWLDRLGHATTRTSSRALGCSANNDTPITLPQYIALRVSSIEMRQGEHHVK